MAIVLNPKYFKQKKGYTTSPCQLNSQMVTLKSLDPTRGFNIKTNFPKMENKNT